MPGLQGQPVHMAGDVRPQIPRGDPSRPPILSGTPVASRPPLLPVALINARSP